MTARAWLPAAALDDESVKGPVAAAVERWSVEWTGAPPASIVFETAVGAPREPQAPWSVHRSAVGIAEGSLEASGFLHRALALEREPRDMSASESAVVGTFATAMAAGLAGTLEEALGLRKGADAGPAAGGPLGDGGMVVGVHALAGKPALKVALPAAPLINLRRRAVARGAAPGSELCRLSVAVGSTMVKLSVLLGEAPISLGELRGLGGGDVLRLDRKLGEGAVLRLVASGREVATAALVEGPDTVALRICKEGHARAAA